MTLPITRFEYISSITWIMPQQTKIDYDSETDIGGYLNHTVSIPTKRPRTNETPRQKPHQLQYGFTPRARIPQPVFSQRTCAASSQPPISTQKDSSRKGFSLSYFRRVPELSLLASRVIHAVARRRQREERKRQKDAGIPSSRSQKSSSVPLRTTGRSLPNNLGTF